MALDKTLTKEEFTNGVRTNGLILNNNKYYNNSGSGISTCITGRPTRSGANVLCNCVGLAWGAYNETWNKCDSTHTGFRRVNGNADLIIDNASKDSFFKDYVLPVTAKPPEGGLIVWADQHVAYIAKVHSNDSITIIQSGYDYGPWTEANNAGTGWCNDTRTISRNTGGTNCWYYHDGCGCYGFLANPGVIKRDSGSVTPEPEVTKYGVYIGDKFYSAHIYNGTKWVKATPEIYNGSKWENCSK